MEFAEDELFSAEVANNGAFVISSAKYRQITSSLVRPESIENGPCSNGRPETALLNYFASAFWPPSASSCQNKCHSCTPPPVVDDIVRSGCHFVAIRYILGNMQLKNG